MRSIIASFLLAVSCLSMSACSTPHKRPTPVAVAESERFPPVNLFVDAGDYVTPWQADLMRYLRESVEVAQQFTDVSSRRARWPYTIVITYAVKPPENSAAVTAAAMASAATLFIVPAPIAEIHAVEISVELGGETLHTFTYEEPIKDSIALFDFNKFANVRNAAVDRILSRFFQDLRASKILPTRGDIVEPEPARDVSA
ncbi:hypothetical protein ACQQ2N_01240 [Dokdonella sp. MW10]|uniref:hypothetical protein n=1 Tax=Dokdonella sp. MW10 TaxID=2992926 RepID=UPI003F7F0750